MGSTGSIFDHAGEEYRKKDKQTHDVKQVAPGSPPSPPEPAPLPPIEAPPQKETLSDAEIQQMFETVYKLNDKVAKQLDYAYNWMGISHNEIKSFLENPNNFKDNTQWLKVQQSRANLLGRLEKVIIYEGKEPTKDERKVKEKLEKKKKDDTADKKRKGKTLGARKGWMSM